MRSLSLCCLAASVLLACGARSGLLSGSQRGSLAHAGAGGTSAGSGGGSGAGLSGNGGAGFTGFSGASGAGAGAAGQAGSATGGTSAGSAGNASAGRSGSAGVAGAGTAGGGEAGQAGEAGMPGCLLDCASPPAPACVDARTLRRWSSGTCANGGCVYPSTDSVCLKGCQDGACTPIAVSIGVAESTACATLDHGPVKCWGGTFGGVTGPIDTSNVPPTVVPGLESGVRMVSVGTGTACAVMDSGAVRCWGDGFSGVVTVSGLPPDVTSVACGAPYFDHTCVLSPTQGVVCWGSNNFGQLGNGLTTPSFTYQYDLVNVLGLPASATSISAGANDTCAILAGGQLFCWGMGRYGALGNGTFGNSPLPVPVSGFSSGTLAVSAGEEYSCAVTPLGTVKCWGWVADGAQNIALPLDIAGVSQVSSLSVDGSACAVTSAGALKCWGADAFGELGDGNTSSSYTTAVDPIGMASGVLAVGVGEYGACAVLETGTIKCWGLAPGGHGAVPQDLVGF